MWYVSTHFNWSRWLQITEHIRLRVCVYLLYIAAINLHRWIARARLFSSVHYIRSDIDWASGWEAKSERNTESIDWNDSLRIGFLFFAIFISEFLPFTFSRWKCVLFPFIRSHTSFWLFKQSLLVCFFCAYKNIYYATVVYVDRSCYSLSFSLCVGLCLCFYSLSTSRSNRKFAHFI